MTVTKRVPNPSAVLDLPLNEGDGTTAYDDTKYGNNGTIIGATWNGTKLSFDGTASDYLLVPYISAYDFGVSKDFSVSCWFKGDAQTASKTKWLVQKGDANVNYGIVASNQTSVFFVISDNTQTPTALWSFYIGNILDGNWHHVVGMRSGDNLLVYIDGIIHGNPITGASVYNLINASGYVSVGNATSPSNDAGFDGEISDIQIFNRALTADEVASFYSSNGFYPCIDILLKKLEIPKTISIDTKLKKTGVISQYIADTKLKKIKAASPAYSIDIDLEIFIPKNIVSYSKVLRYPFDENNGGSTVTDWSDGGNDGTICDSSGFPANGTWVVGNYGYALSFDGTHYINTPDIQLPFDKPFAVNVWVNVSSSPNTYFWLFNSSACYVFLYYDGNVVFIQQWSTVDDDYDPSPLIYFSPNVWTMLTFVWDGSKKSIYVNGIFKQSKNKNSAGSGKGLQIGMAGGMPTSYWYKGAIDEFQIFDKALSADLVSTLYNKGPMFSNLVDLLIAKRTKITNKIDIQLKVLGILRTYSIDTITLEHLYNKFLIDTILEKLGATTTNSIDVTFKKFALIQSSNIDVILSNIRVLGSMLDLDVLLKKTKIKQEYSLDVNLNKPLKTTYRLDTDLQSTMERKCNVDTQLKQTNIERGCGFDVIFTLPTFSLIVTCNTGGTVTPFGTITDIPCGTWKICQATVTDSTYHFTGWYLNGSFYSYNTNIFLPITENTILFADFELIAPNPPISVIWDDDGTVFWETIGIATYEDDNGTGAGTIGVKHGINSYRITLDTSVGIQFYHDYWDTYATTVNLTGGQYISFWFYGQGDGKEFEIYIQTWTNVYTKYFTDDFAGWHLYTFNRSGFGSGFVPDDNSWDLVTYIAFWNIDELYTGTVYGFDYLIVSGPVPILGGGGANILEENKKYEATRSAEETYNPKPLDEEQQKELRKAIKRIEESKEKRLEPTDDYHK